MVSLLSEFRATLPFLQLRSGERDQNIINEVGAALLPRSGLVLTYNAAPHTLDSNQQRFLIALAEKLISNLRMQIVHRVQTYRVVT